MAGEREQVAEIIWNATLPYENLQQTLALALLVLAKHDRADDEFGSDFTDAELATKDHFTAEEMGWFRERARIMLAQFSSYLAIPEANFWAGWGRPVIQGLLSAFIYSLLIIAIAIVAKLGGHDLIDILRDALKPG